MTLASIVVGAVTFGFGLIVTWLISIIWGVVSVQSYNEALQGNQNGQGNTHDGAQSQTQGAQHSQTATSTTSSMGSHTSDPDEHFKEIVRGYEKNCPMCDETIKFFAKKCKHCGAKFSDEDVARDIDKEVQKLKELEEQEKKIKATVGEKENEMLLKGFKSDIQRMFPEYKDIVLTPFKFYIVVKAKDQYNLLDISGFKPKKIYKETLETDDFTGLRSWLGDTFTRVPSRGK